ncbi:MAG: type II toxin-antitoxin system prevent-host-death family antitoxin [Rhodoferax sp.]|nr:type II toxin-antitoxin system prevent-host-death family antitoxin [Rhodoferax sp.]
MRTTPTKPTTTAWRLQDAKAQFSELVDNALRGVPQHVTRRGKQAVVVLSENDFEALQRHAANRSKRLIGLIERAGNAEDARSIEVKEANRCRHRIPQHRLATA